MINSDRRKKRDFRPADHAAWPKDAGSLAYVLAGPADIRARRHVEREPHEIAPPRRLLLHDDSIRALGQCCARHDAMGGARSQRARWIARARAAYCGENQGHPSPADQAYRIAVHCRLVERRNSARRFDGSCQDTSDGIGHRHHFRLVQRP
jgi:hypothetical protein